jgi:hypothetical protein
LVRTGNLVAEHRHAFPNRCTYFCAFLYFPTLDRADYKTSDPPNAQRFEQLWLVTFIDDNGHEAVAQAQTTSGDFVPLIAADAVRLKDIVETGKALAKPHNTKMRLIKFRNRSDVDEFSP